MSIPKLEKIQFDYIKKAESIAFLNEVNSVEKLNGKINSILNDFIEPITKIDPKSYKVTVTGDTSIHNIYGKEFEIIKGSNSIDIRKVKHDGVSRVLLIRVEDSGEVLKSNGINKKPTVLEKSDLYTAIVNVLS